MKIEYKDTKDFQANELQELFLSVEWVSGKYPYRLVKAMQNSGSVFSAWDNDKLVGLINALDDGDMTAYVHYLLINPAYQGKGIGKSLLQMVKEKYKDYLRIVLISENREVGFYKNSGFVVGEETTAMFADSF